MPPFLWFLNPHLYQAHLREVCGGCWPLEWVQESVTAVSLPGAMLFESTAVQAGLEFQTMFLRFGVFRGGADGTAGVAPGPRRRPRDTGAQQGRKRRQKKHRRPMRQERLRRAVCVKNRGGVKAGGARQRRSYSRRWSI